MPKVATPSLRDRIKAAAAASAPSMVPPTDKAEAPPSKEVAVVPPLASLVPDRKTSLTLSSMVWRMGELSRQSSALAKEKKPLAEAIKKLAGKYKIGEALTGDWKMSYYASPRATIKADMLKKALLNRGLLPDEIDEIIKDSTTTSDGYTLKVSALGAAEIEEGEE